MSQFSAATTTDDVMQGVDLSGKTFVVTGASSGLGIEVCRVYAKAGATVVMAVRDLEKVKPVMASIRAEVPGATLEAVQLDLADLRSVRECADIILARYSCIDVLVNNAGIMCVPQGYTAQGCEMQFGTNHIGHFLLTCLLVPALKRARNARIVVVSSLAHQYGNVNFDDLHYRNRPYKKWEAYGQSKTANMLFAVALTKRLKHYGITANALHPGAIATDLGRYMPADENEAIRANSSKMVTWKSIPQGAATEVWAAVSPDLAGISGQYLEDCQLSQPAEAGQAKGFCAYALDPEAAERLWDVSEQIVGQRFVF